MLWLIRAASPDLDHDQPMKLRSWKYSIFSRVRVPGISLNSQSPSAWQGWALMRKSLKNITTLEHMKTRFVILQGYKIPSHKVHFSLQMWQSIKNITVSKANFPGKSTKFQKNNHNNNCFTTMTIILMMSYTPKWELIITIINEYTKLGRNLKILWFYLLAKLVWQIDVKI